MAIAWGDQWTNMIQPFWALPALGDCRPVRPQHHGLSGHHYDLYWPGGLRRIPALGTPVLGIKLHVNRGHHETVQRFRRMKFLRK
ncbi:MAG: TIGR00366 family protein [Flavonifractor plautii]